MLVIKSRYNFINIDTIASSAGINKELVSLRRAEGSSRLWRAWISSEIENVNKAEKDLLWALICNGHEAIIMENNKKGWRRAIR